MNLKPKLLLCFVSSILCVSLCSCNQKETDPSKLFEENFHKEIDLGSIEYTYYDFSKSNIYMSYKYDEESEKIVLRTSELYPANTNLYIVLVTELKFKLGDFINAECYASVVKRHSSNASSNGTIEYIFKDMYFFQNGMFWYKLVSTSHNEGEFSDYSECPTNYGSYSSDCLRDINYAFDSIKESFEYCNIPISFVTGIE